MRNFSFLLTLACVLMLLISCSDDNEYVIRGIAKDYPDGTPVYLQMRDKPNWISIDSTTIKDGMFTMKGEIDPGFLGYITVGETHTMIVVEPGNITIDLNEGKPHGTACNETLVQYNTAIRAMDDEIDEINAKMDELDVSDTAAFAKYGARIDELYKDEMLLLAKYIKKNITNPLGVGLYCSFNSVFSDDVDFLFSISQKIPKEYLQQTYVSKVIENISIISFTSVGNQYTNLVMTTREGNEITLDSLVKTKKYVLIDFWASWCSLCRVTFHGIRYLNEQYKDKGLCIIGISLDELRKDWEDAIEKYQMDWIQVSDLKGLNSEYSKAYGVMAIPTTILIDSSGTIIGRNLQAAQIAEIIESDLVEMN